MPVRYLSHAELARLSGWPEEIGDKDTVTFFTLPGTTLSGSMSGLGSGFPV